MLFLSGSTRVDSSSAIIREQIAASPLLPSNVHPDWTAAPEANEEALILGGSVNTVIKKEFPQRKALKRERSRTLGFRVVEE